MRIKRQSKPKITSEKQLNLTVTGRMFDKEMKQSKLPPLNSTFRRSMMKLPPKKQNQSRKETETTLNQSSLFQSYYNNTSKNWIKPSDYIKDIKQLNLLGEQEDTDISKYQINLKEGNTKNVQKIQSLFVLVDKWISIIKKALFYITSLKSTSDKLIEQVKFWKALSKKFDELQYQFNDKKIVELANLMKRIVKTHPEHRNKFQEFIELKQKAIKMTHPVKKIYMSLEESVVGNLQKFEVNSDIGQSLDLLKKILMGFQSVAEENDILRSRMQIVFKKMDLCMIQKLLAAPLYPRQLAHISSLKQKYVLIDKALSFYSHFLSILQEQQNRQLETIIQNATYTQSVLVNLLQILSFLEYLYHKKDVYEFSYLSTNDIQYNIYEISSKQQWLEYMAKVEKSMQKNKFQP